MNESAPYRPQTMEEFGRTRVSELLDAFIFELHRTARLQDAESVHRLRVSIRRMGQALRVFSAYLPHKELTRIKKQIRAVMKAAGEVRNLDIALEFLSDAGLRIEEVHERRRAAKALLQRELQSIARPGLSMKWRIRLGLNG